MPSVNTKIFSLLRNGIDYVLKIFQANFLPQASDLSGMTKVGISEGSLRLGEIGSMEFVIEAG